MSSTYRIWEKKNLIVEAFLLEPWNVVYLSTDSVASSSSFILLLQVIEITKGSKVKYELDKKTGLIKVWWSSFSMCWVWDYFQYEATFFHIHTIRICRSGCNLIKKHKSISSKITFGLWICLVICLDALCSLCLTMAP